MEWLFTRNTNSNDRMSSSREIQIREPLGKSGSCNAYAGELEVNEQSVETVN